jgi:hypothetical protein
VMAMCAFAGLVNQLDTLVAGRAAKDDAIWLQRPLIDLVEFLLSITRASTFIASVASISITSLLW